MVDSLVLDTYPFRIKPYEHQHIALEKSWQETVYAYFMEMGTGKTKVAIDNSALLYDHSGIEGVVVVAPKGVYANWSGKEIPEHMPSHIPYRVATWRASLNVKVRAEINHLFEETDDLRIFVINIDALITKKGYAALEKFLKTYRCLMIIDESTIIKTPSAKRTKAAIKLGLLAYYRRILTGSPVTKSPLDLFSQLEFLDPDLLGFRSFYAFRNRYAVLRDMNYGGRTFKQVVGFKNVPELAEEIKPFSYRVLKEDCLDLPEKIFVRREFELSTEQRKAYAEMKEMAIAFMEEGEASSTSALTQLLRLHQISCGHLPLDQDQGMVQFKHDRLNLLKEVLEEADGKVIIWANYRFNLFEIQDMLTEKYGDDSYVSYFGDTSDEDRKRAVLSFQDPDSPVRYFVGNTQTGGYGITLTQAKTVVYYSNNYDLEKRLQSEDRAHRIGQHFPVTYIDLVCTNTIDEKIIKALRNKVNIARAVTGDKWHDWL